MIKDKYNWKLVFLYIFITFGVLFFIGFCGLETRKNIENPYIQKEYELKIPNRNCKMYVIYINGVGETKLIDCDGIISAPVQIEHHSTSTGASHTNNVTPIVIKDK